MTVEQVRRTFVTLTAMRWLPTGLTVPALVLIGQARGLSLAQIGMITAVYGVTTLLLELPTGGLSDVIGRRPVLVAAGLMSVAAALVTAVGTSFMVLAGAAAIRGAARALDSGPLQSWFVERTLAIDPAANFRAGLSRASAGESIALAAGTLATGGLLVATPLPANDATLIALSTPFLVSAAFACVQVGLVACWVKEPRRTNQLTLPDVIAEVPRTIAGGARLAATHPTLRRLLAVTAAIGAALASIELLTPPHVASVLGSDAEGASAYAVLATLGFVGSAIGATLAPVATKVLRRPSRVPLVGVLGGAVALAATGAQALGSLSVAYVAFYVLLGMGSPLLDELTHRSVTSRERATMLSVGSMALQGAGVVAALTFGPLADRASPRIALAVAAMVLALAAVALVRLPTHGSRNATSARPEDQALVSESEL
jgi:MFS family permease